MAPLPYLIMRASDAGSRAQLGKYGQGPAPIVHADLVVKARPWRDTKPGCRTTYACAIAEEGQQAVAGCSDQSLCCLVVYGTLQKMRSSRLLGIAIRPSLMLKESKEDLVWQPHYSNVCGTARRGEHLSTAQLGAARAV